MRIQDRTDCHLSRLSRFSNDTNCFWMPSYAKRAPGTLTRFIILLSYFGPPPPFVCSFAPVSISVTIARSISSSFRRARLFLALVCGVATVKFDLLGLRTTSRRKCPARFSEHLLKAERLKKMSIRKFHCVLKRAHF